MEITLGPELEGALTEVARRQGITPEELALKVLRERLLPFAPDAAPRRDLSRSLVRLLRTAGSPCPTRPYPVKKCTISGLPP